jgi:hypothetical protein
MAIAPTSQYNFLTTIAFLECFYVVLINKKQLLKQSEDFFSPLLKLNYRKKVLFFALNFLPWEFLLIKKLEIQKTKATFIISVLKVVY